MARLPGPATVTSQLVSYFGSTLHPHCPPLLFFAQPYLTTTAIFGSMQPKFGLIEAALLLLFLIAEPARLALGYSGNLQEKVPFVAAFMLLTLFPGLPVCLYFMFVQKVSLLLYPPT